MPLSDHEQKMLEQLEQALASEDPKFASQMRGSATGARRGRWAVGAVGALAGLALVLIGINTTMWVGAAGFVLMVLSAGYALSPGRPGLRAVQDDGSAGPRKTSRSRKASSGGFMDRLDERWDRRQGGDR